MLILATPSPGGQTIIGSRPLAAPFLKFLVNGKPLLLYGQQGLIGLDARQRRLGASRLMASGAVTAAVVIAAAPVARAFLRVICITSHLRVMARWGLACDVVLKFAAIGSPLPGGWWLGVVGL